MISVTCFDIPSSFPALLEFKHKNIIIRFELTAVGALVVRTLT